MQRRFTFLALCLGLHAACGSEPAPLDPQSDAGVESPDSGEAPAPVCTKDPAALSAKASCLSQESCPCGTRCALGECVADCAQDQDCAAEQRCDEIGLCRDRLDPTLELPPRDPTLPLLIEPSLLILETPDDPRPLAIAAPHGPGGPVRVVAPLGVELACDGTNFQSECRFEAMVAGARLSLPVRLTADIPDRSPRQLRIYSLSGLDTITVEQRPNPARGLALRGSYRGSAVATRLGVLGSLAPLVDAPQALSLPVTARYFPGEGVLELRDPLGVLHPSGALIGAARTGELHFPAYHLPVDRAIAGSDPEVLVQSFTASVAHTGVDQATLSFQLDQRFEGITKPSQLPLVRYQVTLTFESPLPGDLVAPTIPAEEHLLAPIERATLGTPWEAGLFDVTPGPTAAEYRAAHRGERYDVSVCGANEAERLAATHGGVTEIFGDLLNDHTLDYATIGDLLSTNDLLERTLMQAFVPSWGALQLQAPTNARALINLSASAGREVAVDELPCAIALPTRSYTFTNLSGASCDANLPAPITATTEEVDVCGAFATAYDCEVLSPTLVQAERPRLAFFQQVGLQQTLGVNQACSYVSSPQAFEAEIVRVCRLRNPTPTCAEAVLCEGDGDATTPSSQLVDVRSRKTGDLSCLDGTTPTLLELDQASSDQGAATLLKTCIADLDRLAEAPTLTGLSSVLDGGGCVGPRLVLAMEFALDRARRRAFSGSVLPPDAQDALAHRLLQRWLEVHQLLAREALQAENLAAIIRRVDPNDQALPPSIDQILEKSRRGLSLFFHPRWAIALDALPVEILASPDYRRFYEVTPLAPNPNHEQPLGLSVGLDETLTAQLALAELRLKRARFAPDPGAVADSGALLRQVIVAYVISTDLRGRAQAFATAAGDRLSWEVRADASRAALNRTLLGVISEVDLLTRGKNPLGIEDSDLPLYFLGDEVGPGHKFSAISDFLLGSNPGALSAWAPSAVRQAEGSLAQARDAWNAFKARQLQREITAGELDRNLDRLRFEFGDRIANYCSAPDTLATAGILEEWEQHHGRPFSASNCYLRLQDPKCELDLSKYTTLLRSADMGYQLCVARRLQDRTRAPIPFTEPAWGVAMACAEAAPTMPVTCGDGVPACATCDLGGVQVPIDLRQAPQQLAAVSRAAVAPALLTEIQNGCAALYPNANLTLPSLAQVASVDYDQGRCYRGQLGEQALTIRAATKDIEIAKAELAEHQESYNLAMASCFILETGNQQLRDAQLSHNETMRGMNIAKAAVDAAAEVAGGAKECTAAAGQDVTLGISTGLACGLGAIETAAKVAGIALQTAMDEVERSHEATMMKLEADVAEDICFKDAEQFLVGTRADTLRVQRALQDLEVAIYQFNEMRIAADTYYADGQAALAVLRDRTVIPPTHDYWLSEAVTTFTRDLSYAKRLSYLAVRAVEYEYQQSLALRSQVLAAEIPDELQAVLQELSATAGTRSIGGRPAELHEVFSLRRDLFQLPANFPANRDPFRLRIKDPRQSVISPDGRYLGQLIPFTLRPELIAGEDCAERLWSISVNLVGRSGVLQGEAPTVRLEVQKKNTFYSRWCSEAGREAPVQLASVRPTKNLLRGGDSGLGLDRSIDDFGSARINGWVNVPASEFFDSRYEDASSELAARGLYGDYALFIPVESMSNGGSDGLVLSQIEDVQIRFDYVSVAKP